MVRNDSKFLFFLLVFILGIQSCSRFGNYNLIDAIPESSHFFVKFKNGKTFQNFNSESSIASLPFFNKLSKDWGGFSKYVNVNNNFERYEFAVALLNTSVDESEFVFILDLGEKKINDLSEVLKNRNDFQKRKFNNIPIWQIKNKISISKIDNLLLFSKYGQLIEDVLHHLESGKSISRLGLNHNSKDVNIFAVIESEIRKPNLAFPDFDWIRFDIDMKQPLAIAGEIKKRPKYNVTTVGFENEILQILPNSIAYCSATILSKPDLSIFRKYVYSAILTTSSLDERTFFIRKIKDESNFQDFIRKIKESQEPEDYNGFDLLKTTKIFDADLYFCDMNGYVVSTKNKKSLKLWIDAFISAQVLGHDIEFLQLQNDFSSENKISNYLNFTYFSNFLKSKMNKMPADISLVFDGLSKVGRVLLSTSQSSERYIFQGIIQKKADNSLNEDGIVWKTKFSNTIESKPFVVNNIDKSDYSIFVQDGKYSLISLNTKGEKQWNLPLESKIISEIIPIDYFRDHSTFYFFNTKDKIHIIDQKGEYLKGYPMSLNVKANVGALVIDFENEDGIQYYIGCENGKIYGFNKLGSPLSGWNPCENNGNLLQSLKHFQSDTKDFIFGINDKQEVRIYQKNGKPRFNNHFILDTTAIKCNFDHLESKERIIAISESGKAKVINTEGNSFGLNLSKNKVIDFLYFDFIGDSRKDFVILSKNRVEGFFYNGNKVEKAFSKKLKLNYSKLSKIRLPHTTKGYIGLFDPIKNRISIIDEQGKQLPQFPLRATQSFDVIDLFHRRKSVLIGVYKQQVYAYQL